MKIFIIVLVCVLALFLIILPSILFFYAGGKMKRMLKKSDKKISSMPGMDISFYNNGPMKEAANKGLEFMDTLQHKDIYMTSFDGYKLHAYYYPNPNGETKKIFLGMHGFKSGPRHEYAPYIKKYFELGFSLILPDERAHYLSEGKYITLGCNEQYDTIDWAKKIVSMFGEDIQILIQGVSMGGASVNLAAGLDLPKQVIGIISDCAYTSFNDIMENVMHKFGNFNPKPIIWMLDLYLKLFLHIDLKKSSPIESVKNAKVPILYVHGKLDQIVPVECSQKLYDACSSRKKLWIVDEANHAECIGYRLDEYFNNIKEFFNL